MTQEGGEAVCSGDPNVYPESSKDRPVLLGTTPAGRVFAVLLGPVPHAPAGTFDPFTARPADRTERREYRRSKGSPAP